ncbi:hypothetical protein GSH19_01760 [Lactobacillus sp. S2-2]|uniref:helix-hairpin-helix domain-containing protein n=1 Tax=Lactobacillus sp. S2-2 TaxID=2692917 RepID=UPI001F230A1B|nr:helix-hairpin-helix domain-containing protein [Lactobacillus sp. S2-2]MCF6514889.1 hypothetical protein [Lactobacillus sp. S2-2]
MDRIKEIYYEYKNQILIGAIILLMFLILFLLFFISNDKQGTNDEYFSSSLSSNSSEITNTKVETNEVNESKDDNKIYVDIKGAVKSPGMYEVTSQMRLSDTIELADGFNKSADVKHVNLSKKLVDQEVIYIPIRGEIKGSPNDLNVTSNDTDNQQDSSNNKSDSTKVNLNSAEKSSLTTLNGIGDKKADQIIDFRKQNGPFNSVDDLKKVPGFGDKTVDNLREFVSV